MVIGLFGISGISIRHTNSCRYCNTTTAWLFHSISRSMELFSPIGFLWLAFIKQRHTQWRFLYQSDRLLILNESTINSSQATGFQVIVVEDQIYHSSFLIRFTLKVLGCCSDFEEMCFAMICHVAKQSYFPLSWHRVLWISMLQIWKITFQNKSAGYDINQGDVAWSNIIWNLIQQSNDYHKISIKFWTLIT